MSLLLVIKDYLINLIILIEPRSFIKIINPHINKCEKMISIIIPIYNVEKYLFDCLSSVLNQTYTNFEVICVDDCSTDSSLQIAEEFAKADPRIKILKNEVNSSLGYSRNKGLKHAKGKYVLFLDSDDWLDFRTFEILHETAEKNPVDVLMFKLINYDEDEKLFYHDDYYDMKFMDKYFNKIFTHEDLSPHEILSMPVSAVNKFYLLSFILKNDLKFPVKLIHEDNPFFYKMLYSARSISLIDYYFYNRRRRLGSITTNDGEQVLGCINIIEICIKIALDDPILYEKLKVQVLNKIIQRLNVKYNFISSEFKEEFYNNSRKMVKKICSEHPYLKNDFENYLYQDNLNFYNFLDIDNI